MFDLIMKNAAVATESGLVRATLGIEDGRVSAWLAPDAAAQARETVDCGGKYLLPGMVDMHFHCRVPGRSDREDFDTATMSAAKGGVTTIIEMPIAKPSPHDAQTLRNRIAYAEPLAVVDYGFYAAGATRDSAKAAELAEAGAMGFKIFLHAQPKGREDEFHDLCAVGSAELYESLRANAGTGLITCVHAEDDGLIRARTAQFGKGEKNTYLQQMETRPPEAEELAILTAGLAASLAGARLHICHISSENGIRALRYLKNSGGDVTGESCPPYLWLDADLMRVFGSYAKVNPPIRDGRHKTALLSALQDGTLDAISSDHAPFLPAEKEVADFLLAPSGMPGVEFFGPSVIDRVLRGELSLAQAVHFTAASPARLLGLYGKKGTLEVGADADMVLVDPDRDMQADISRSFSKSSKSLYPYHSKIFRGRIDKTFLRGKVVYGDGSILVDRGYGCFLPGAGAPKH